MLYWIVKIIFFIPSLIAYPVLVKGRKNLPKGRLILSANHQTLNDPPIIGFKINRRFKYIAKYSLFKNKFFSWFLKQMGAYPVNTKKNDITAIKQTLRYLNNDHAVCIFPEGTRIETSEDNELKHGVALFALKTKSPVVPAYFLRKTYFFVPNKLIIGKPIYLHELPDFKDKKIDKELLIKATQIISENIHTLR